MRLKVIGNATLDTIYDSEKLIMIRKGGIYNITRRLTIPHRHYSKQQDQIKVQLSPSTTYEVDQQNSDFTGMKFENTFWTHISYLDRVDIDVNDLNTSMVSADICMSSYTDTELAALFDRLKDIDVLIIGVMNLRALGLTLNELLNSVSAVILRTKELVIVGGQHGCSSYPNEYIEVVNDVGAGDAFVAGWLNYIVTYKAGELDMEKAIANCVNSSIQHLKEQNV